MTDFQYARCPKSGTTHEGQHIGDILSQGTISIQHRTKPNTPIARYTKCCRPTCSYIGDMWLIPGAKIDDKREQSEAEKHGITLDMVRICFKAMPLDCYTLNELKAGKVRGASQKPIDYEPDKFIQPREIPQERIF